MDDIHSIKPLITIDFPYLSLGILLLIILILVQLIIYLFFKYKKKHLEINPQPTYNLEKKSGEIALEKLIKLKNSNLLRQEHSQPFYFNLSQIIRQYFQDFYKVSSTAFTYQQLKEWLMKEHPKLWDEYKFPTMIENSMHAKYALKVIDEIAMLNDVEVSIELVFKDSIAEHIEVIIQACSDATIKLKLDRILKENQEKRKKSLKRLLDQLHKQKKSTELLVALSYLKTDYIAEKLLDKLD